MLVRVRQHYVRPNNQSFDETHFLVSEIRCIVNQSRPLLFFLPLLKVVRSVGCLSWCEDDGRRGAGGGASAERRKLGPRQEGVPEEADEATKDQ